MLTGYINDNQNLIGKINSGNGIKGFVDIPEKFTVTFKSDYTVLQQVQVMNGQTAKYNGTVSPKENNAFLGWVLNKPENDVIDPDIFGGNIYQRINDVREDITCWAVYNNHKIIHDSWEVISQRSLAGTAGDYYNIGDMKLIHVDGWVGIQRLSRDLYVYILDFDHDSALGENGITFCCFKDLVKFNPVGICTGDSYRWGISYNNGEKVTNMYHWCDANNVVNYGGWAGSDMRYDILGSTDVAPSGYGAAPTSSREGYDATATCATNPVANTLMSCLPSDLRAVMKPMTKYTDERNSSGDENRTIDYLPLASVFECIGDKGYRYSNPYVGDKQKNYRYFNSSLSYMLKAFTSNNDSLYNGTSIIEWLRNSDGSSNFCVHAGSATVGIYRSDYAVMIVPIFLV